MEEKVPIRIVTIYQADDGRRIEKYTFNRLLSEDIDNEINISSSEKEFYFLGIAGIQTPMGIHEVKFPIDVKNLNEAFLKFQDSLEEFVKETQNQIIQPGNDNIIV